MASYSFWISLAFSWMLRRLNTIKDVYWLFLFLVCQSRVCMTLSFYTELFDASGIELCGWCELEIFFWQMDSHPHLVSVVFFLYWFICYVRYILNSQIHSQSLSSVPLFYFSFMANTTLFELLELYNINICFAYLYLDIW